MKEEKLKIGIDLDNTITSSIESMAFFALITNALKNKAEIHIITNRPTDDNSVKETIQELSQLDIHYDYLKVTADKAEYIIDNNINVYVDDTDEYFINLPESVTVFKIREAGNFDFIHHKWLYGNKTGKNIDIRGK